MQKNQPLWAAPAGLVLLLGFVVAFSGPVHAADKDRGGDPGSQGVAGADAGGGNSDSDSGAAPVKFQPATKEQADAEIAAVKHDAAEIATKFEFTLQTIETQHFLIFTDWDPREYPFLKTNVEAAYAAVSEQFNIPVSDDIFIGKLPVFMFATQKSFTKFADQVDHFSAPKNVAGYYRGNSHGFGHLLMWKPTKEMAGGNLELAERNWAYTLTHEFTHAFVARYRTNAFIPRWLNEGLAEVIACRKFPRPGLEAYVRRLAGNGKTIQDLFKDDEGLLPAGEYPIAQTVVETLIVGDSRAFLKMFNDIKDGMKPEDALQKNYHVDYHGLEEAWRRFLKSER